MKVLLLNNPALRQVCEPVQEHELEYVKSLLPEMAQLIIDNNGAALAANQVGIIRRFFLLRDGTLIINPEILESSEPEEFEEEGCLSIPGVSGSTMRSYKVKLSYRDQDFKLVETEYNGFDAIAIQHEIDHLDGKLYIDQLGNMKRTLLLNKYSKLKKAGI
jgi:peptide deformylase